MLGYGLLLTYVKKWLKGLKVNLSGMRCRRWEQRHSYGSGDAVFKAEAIFQHQGSRMSVVKGVIFIKTSHQLFCSFGNKNFGLKGEGKGRIN